MPSTIESIWDSAFYLQKIEWEFIFPESLTTLWTAVFKGNNLSWTLTVPWRLNWWRLNGAFRCNEFESVIVESWISLIWENAFYDKTDCPESKFKIKKMFNYHQRWRELNLMLLGIIN